MFTSKPDYLNLSNFIVQLLIWGSFMALLGSCASDGTPVRNLGGTFVVSTVDTQDGDIYRFLDLEINLLDHDGSDEVV